jgi:RNA polymerase sigma factor (sigma-70 family)
MTAGHLLSLLGGLRWLRDVPGSALAGDGNLLERFVHDGNEDAFTELIRRHGPMVLGVCRRVLGTSPEAEDSFQTTFLLLVRKAGQLRKPEALGPWLHGVAYRTALKARTQARRRRQREQPLQDHPAPQNNEVVWRELAGVLDQAINQLPDRYRAPFILCYLQGLTGAEAARQLGCAPGTVGTRLSRAREWLRKRLVRRGVTLSAAALTAVLAETPLSAAVPFGLIHKAVAAVTGTLPASVALLLKGVCQNMFLDKMRTVCLTLITLAAVGVGTGALMYRALAGEPVPRPAPAPESIAPPPVVRGPAAEETSQAHRTPNFDVRAPYRRIAQLIGDEAERQRKAQALRWLKKELADWPKPCTIDVTIRPGGTGGATSFAFDNGQVKEQRMHLEGPLDRLLASVLPHEVTHTILAHHLGQPVPRWADEGAAVMSEDEEERQRHDKVAREILATPGRAIPLKRLLVMQDYPPDVMVLFAQGYALTRFLVERQDHQTFLRFVRDGKGNRWDQAVKAHYGLANVEELEAVWLTAMRRKPPQDPDPDPEPTPQGALSRNPPPITTLASVTAEGKLHIQKLVSFAHPVTRYTTGEGRYIPQTTYVQGTTIATTLHDLDKVKASDVQGRPIEAKQLRKLLAQEKAVVLSADGKKVDPFYLQVLKEDTVILVVPEPSAVPAPPPYAPLAPAAKP